MVEGTNLCNTLNDLKNTSHVISVVGQLECDFPNSCRFSATLYTILKIKNANILNVDIESILLGVYNKNEKNLLYFLIIV